MSQNVTIFDRPLAAAFFIQTIVMSTSQAFGQGTAYPADLTPRPVIVYSTERLTSGYSGHAAAVWKTTAGANPSQQQMVVDFAGDSLDVVALNGFLNNNNALYESHGRLTKWFDQMRNVDAVNSMENSPKISAQKIGQSRALIFEGGSQSNPSIPPNGSIDSLILDPDRLNTLGITSQAYTVIAVVQPSLALARNQLTVLKPTYGTLFSLQGAGVPIVSIINDGREGSVGWGVSAGDSSFADRSMFVETSPTVMAWIADSSGTRIWQNETLASSTAKSTLTNQAIIGYIGKHALSVPGPDSGAFDGKLAALMVYKVALTSSQRSSVFQALYQRFKINPQNKTNSVLFTGDSIAAGYTGLGVNGFEKRVQTKISGLARFGNFSVAGIPVQTNNPVNYSWTNLVELFDTSMASYMKASSGRNILVVSGGGNDYGNPSDYITTYWGIRELVNKAKNSGIDEVIVCTVLPRISPNDTTEQDTFITPLNQLLRSDGGVHYRLCDLGLTGAGQDPRTNGYYYYADGTHPNGFGHEDVANFLAPLIDQALLAPKRPRCNVSASYAPAYPGKETIYVGQTVNLSWTTQDATSAMLSVPGVGNFQRPVNGSEPWTLLSPGRWNFDLYLSSASGVTNNCGVTVNVVSPPSCVVNVSPENPRVSDTVTLSWSSVNAANDGLFAIPATLQNLPAHPGSGGSQQYRLPSQTAPGPITFELHIGDVYGKTATCSKTVNFRP